MEEKYNIDKEIEFVRSDSILSVFENTPILKFILFGSASLYRLYDSFKNESHESLQKLKDNYALLTITGHEDDFMTSVIYDISFKDIMEPADIKFYIQNRKVYQTLETHCPKIISTFVYDDRSKLIEKFANIIFVAFKRIKGDQLIISAPYNYRLTNADMQGVLDETIHTRFNVISELFDNETFNKYYVIKEKEKKENDSDAN